MIEIDDAYADKIREVINSLAMQGIPNSILDELWVWYDEKYS